jgi:hypothetical protein
MELKNEMELSNLKFQRVSDENFSMRREIQILEKEVKSKNDLIDKYKNEIIEIRNSRNNSINFDKLNYDLEDKRSNSNSSLNNHTYFQSTNESFGNIIQKSPSYHNSYNNNNLNPQIASQTNNINNNKNNFNTKNITNNTNYEQNQNKPLNTQNKKQTSYNLNSASSSETQYTFDRVGSQDKFKETSNHTIKENISNNSLANKSMYNLNQQSMNHHETKINILPSQKEIVQKETRILQIETKLFSLQQEREKVNFNKLFTNKFTTFIKSSKLY